ncbi:MAG: hypothetical protein JXB62_01905 [Pirellulales bacterium]|nr:hypothetical protein [Pirellulales bacterium]
MKKISVAALTLSALVAIPVLAQNQPGRQPPVSSTRSSLGSVSPTPEMWFYEQYKNEYSDPKQAVREKAEFRAAQRQRRIAAKKWFGFSNQRPTCFSDPFHGDWSPSWTSNNPWYPFRWQGVGQPYVVLRSSGAKTQLY